MFSHLKNSKLQGNVGMAYAIAFYSIPVKELEGIRTSISLCDKYKVEL